MPTRTTVLAALLATMLGAGVSVAQITFSYGAEISGRLDRIGPIGFQSTGEVGALARFVMDGAAPDRDKTDMDGAISAACTALGDRLMDAVGDVSRNDYTHLVIMFSWVTSEIDQVKNFANYTGVFRAGSCEPIKRKTN